MPVVTFVQTAGRRPMKEVDLSPRESPLNGALFTAKDILGNVRIAGNHVIDAYNGIRVRLSDACLASPRCRERANAGFEIVGNTFERIRDNAIEPEGRAEQWIIKHNA